RGPPRDRRLRQVHRRRADSRPTPKGRYKTGRRVLGAVAAAPHSLAPPGHFVGSRAGARICGRKRRASTGLATEGKGVQSLAVHRKGLPVTGSGRLLAAPCSSPSTARTRG